MWPYVCFLGHHSVFLTLLRHCIQGTLARHPCRDVPIMVLKVQENLVVTALINVMLLHEAADSEFQICDVRTILCWRHRADC